MRGLRGQSETVGVVLLTAVIVILTVTAGAFILSDFRSQAEDDPNASIESTITAESLEIRHRGGDAFDTGRIAIIVTDAAGERTYRLGEDFTETGGNTGSFEPGDRWRRDLLAADELLAGEVRLLVVDQESNTIIYESSAVVGSTGLRLTLDEDRIATDGSTNYTVNRVFEQGTTRDVTGEATVASGNTTVATVDGGTTEVVGNETGSTTVTAELPDENFTDSTVIEVVEPGSLTVTELSHDNPATVGDTLTVTATVENTGGLPASGSVSLRPVRDSALAPAANTTTLSLAPGESRVLTFPYEISEADVVGVGNLAVRVSTSDDPAGEQLPVETRLPRAILSVVDVQPGSNVVETEMLPVTVTVENVGEEDARSAPVELVVGDSTTPVDTALVNVSAGATTTVDLAYGTAVGDAPSIDLTVSTGDANATVTADLIPGQPDPQVRSLALDAPTPLVVGDTVAAEITVENAGEVAATNLSVDLAAAGSVVDQTTLPSLPAGETRTVTLSTEPLAGGDLSLTASAAGTQRSETITVNEPASFDVEILSVDDDILQGQPFDLTARITNTGDISGTQQVELSDAGFVLGEILDTTTVSLAGGESTTLTLTGTIDATGTGDVEVASDDDTATEQITVSPTGLTGFAIDPETPVVAGETMSIEVDTGVLGILGTRIDVYKNSIGDELILRQTTRSTSTTLQWETRLEDTGSYTLAARGETLFIVIGTDQQTVTVAEPTFTVTTLTAPNETEAGTNISVAANVSTNAPATDSQTVELRFGDNLTGQQGSDYQVLANRTVTLGNRNTTGVTFEVAIPGDATTGERSVGVFTEDEGRTATLTVIG